MNGNGGARRIRLYTGIPKRALADMCADRGLDSLGNMFELRRRLVASDAGSAHAGAAHDGDRDDGVAGNVLARRDDDSANGGDEDMVVTGDTESQRDGAAGQLATEGGYDVSDAMIGVMAVGMPAGGKRQHDGEGSVSSSGAQRGRSAAKRGR